MAKKADGQEPSFWTTSDIVAAQTQGQKLRDNPQSALVPKMAGWNQKAETEGRDILMSALTGFGRSNAAALEASKYGDPMVAALAAIGGMGGTPGPQDYANDRQKQQQAAQMAAIKNMPIGAVSPDLAKEFGLDPNTPMAAVEQFLPLMQRHYALVKEQKDKEEKAISEQMTPQEKKLLAQQMGIDVKDLEGVRRGAVSSLGLSPKVMSAEASIKLSLAQDGKSNIDDIRTILKGPRARELILKAGGSWKALSSLGDPDAEVLSNAIFQVADAEARIKTGAAINEKEVEAYFNGLVPKSGTMGGIEDRLNRKMRYFDSIEGGLTFGKRVAQRATPAPAPVTYKQTASNAAGQRIGLNAATGKWEPMR